MSQYDHMEALTHAERNASVAQRVATDALRRAVLAYLSSDGAAQDEAEVVSTFTRWLVAANRWHNAAAALQSASDTRAELRP